MMVAGGKLVMGRALTQMGGVNGSRRGERLQGAIDRAARETRLRLVQLVRDLVSGAVPAQAHDGGVYHRPLRGTPHAWREHQPCGTTRSWRPAVVRTRQPAFSTTTSSSMRTPPHDGM